MDQKLFKSRLKAFAQHIGIAHLGIAHASPAKDYDRYVEWTNKGYAGSMWYLTETTRKEKRKSVQNVFSDAKTAIVVALSYKPKDIDHPTDAKFARYGWGKDYHDFLKQKLDQIIDWIQTDLGRKINAKSYVDTGPILEKNIAESAGIGWMGKNTCLIHPKFGSYIYLGEILVDVEIDPDQPSTHHCGTCTKCLDACPTQAFLAPYKMDATKCISYHTIESKELTMPNEIASHLEGYVAGCDICQEVCPWNNKSPASVLPEVQAGKHIQLTLDDILNLTSNQHQQLFRESSFRRIPLQKLKANAALVQKNKKIH